jgi:hypothetical protein
VAGNLDRTEAGKHARVSRAPERTAIEIHAKLVMPEDGTRER